MKEEKKKPEDEKIYNIFKEGSKKEKYVKVLVKETFSFATQESVTGFRWFEIIYKTTNFLLLAFYKIAL